MSVLETLAQKALSRARLEGAVQAESFVINSHIRSVYVEDSIPHLVDDKLERGLGFKACIEKRIGSASGVLGSNESAEEIVREALKTARTTREDPNFRSLPTGGEVTGEIDSVYCEETAGLTNEDIVGAAMEVVKTAEKERSVKVPLGMLRVADYTFHVSNSNGVAFEHKGTMAFAYFTAKASSGTSVGEGVERAWATTLSSIDFGAMGNSVAEKALKNLRADAFQGELHGITVIDPVECAGLLDVLKFATSAEQVHRRRSPWGQKIGTKVASEKLTVLDDGSLPGGIRSAAADDEGVKTTRKTIIDEGILNSYVSDSYHAYLGGAKPCGNGFRRGTRSIEGAFSTSTSCAYANLIVRPGSKNRDRLISSVEKGVLIERFASPEVNPVTGGFGCEVRDAVMIEGGQLTKHVNHCLLTGNIYECLKKIEDIADDARTVEDLRLPTLAFSGATLVGQ